MTIINESGLYSLVLSSKLPNAKKFKRWVTSEVLPSIRKTGGYTKVQEDISPAREKEIDCKRAELLLKVAEDADIAEYKQVIKSYAINTLMGKDIVPLPEVQERTYSATEIGEIIGISANKVGKLANSHNLKTEEYGKWYHDKSRYSDKLVETFRYYKRIIPVMKSLIGGEA